MSDLKAQQKGITEENQAYIGTQEEKFSNEQEFNEWAKVAAQQQRDDIQKNIDNTSLIIIDLNFSEINPLKIIKKLR